MKRINKGLQKNESGRSMVEMLGVLAVVGLLSVVVVMGLKNAMNRAYAYNLIDEARKRAVVVMTQIQLQGSQNPTLSEFSNNETMAGTFANNVTLDNGRQQFGLQVSGVTAAVCEKILETIDENSALRRLANSTNIHQPITTCDSDGTYLMVYNNDMTPEDKMRTCQTESDCETACAICENNVCTNECEITPTTCTSNSECTNAGVCAGCVKAEGAETGTCQYACEELEYLESARWQYIDTGISGDNDNLSFYMAFDWRGFSASWEGLFGNMRGNNHDCWRILQTSDASSTTLLINTNTRATGDGLTSIYNITWQTRHTLSMDKNSIVVDNSTTYTPSTTTIAKNTNNIYLFRSGPANSIGANVRFYFFQISENGTLIRDFIPVLDPDGTPAMLDRVEPKLYYNQGSGQFSYGLKQQ